MDRIKTEAVVMGSGLAGLAAALTLAEKGVKVDVFEKRPFQGGAVSNTPMITLVTRNEKAYQDKAFQVHCEFTNYDSNMALARTWINNSWRIPEFVYGLGLDFLDKVETTYEELGNINAYTGGFPKGMNLGDYYLLKARGQGHGAALICLKAAQKIKAMGGRIHFNYALQSIKKDGGRVVGATVISKSGDIVDVDCKAIVVATGGFQDNPGMVKEYTGLKLTDRNCSGDGNIIFNHFYNGQMDGEGHQAVWAVGGKKGPVGSGGRLLPGPGVVGYVPWVTRNQLFTVAEQPYLLVNRNGDRFMDESVRVSSISEGAAIRNQPGKYAYLIFDEETLDHLEQIGTEYSYMIFKADKLTNLREQFKTIIEQDHNEHVFVADSLNELCGKAGINEQGLTETVKRYNRFSDEGYDEDFGKDPQYLYPVRKGRYYALRLYTCAYHTFGGISTNGKCEVVDDELLPIKGSTFAPKPENPIFHRGFKPIREVYQIPHPYFVS